MYTNKQIDVTIEPCTLVCSTHVYILIQVLKYDTQ